MKSAAVTGFLALSLLAGCGACSRGGSRDGDADIQQEPEVPEGGEGEVVEDERDMAEAEDALDLSDSVDNLQEFDLPEGLVGYQEPRSFIPSRLPTPCGEGCRQVSFTDDDVFADSDDVFADSVDVWGNYLAFSTMESSSEEGIREAVFFVNLTTLEHFIVIETISTDAIYRAAGYVSIYDNLIVYGLYLWDHLPMLMTYSIDSQYQNLLWTASTDAEIFQSTRIRGHYVSWWDNRSGEQADGRVYLFDMVSRTEREITTEPFFVAGGIDMQGGRVVFTSDNEGNDWPHVFVHDIASGVTEKITTGNWAHMFPSVWGDIVVWTDTRQGGDYVDYGMADIYMYDLSTGIESAVCDNPASQVNGEIWGNIVAWSDFRNDPEYPNTPTRATMDDIYLLNLTTHEERLLPTTTLVPHKKGVRKIRDNKIYFLMTDNAGVQSVFEVTF